MTTEAKKKPTESVKAVCEEQILKERSTNQIMATLRKKFDKDDETYLKSIKYYASALHRAGKIDDEAKAKHCPPVARGRKLGGTNAESKEEKAPKEKAPKRVSRKDKKAEEADEAPVEDKKAKRAARKEKKAGKK